MAEGRSSITVCSSGAMVDRRGLGVAPAPCSLWRRASCALQRRFPHDSAAARSVRTAALEGEGRSVLPWHARLSHLASLAAAIALALGAQAAWCAGAAADRVDEIVGKLRRTTP